MQSQHIDAPARRQEAKARAAAFLDKADEANRLAFEAVEMAWHEMPENFDERIDSPGAALDEADDAQQNAPAYDPAISVVEWQLQREQAAQRSSVRVRSLRFAAIAATVVSWTCSSRRCRSGAQPTFK